MILDKISKLIASKASLVYLVTQEEERVERLVNTAAKKVLGQEAGIYQWSCTTGI